MIVRIIIIIIITAGDQKKRYTHWMMPECRQPVNDDEKSITSRRRGNKMKKNHIAHRGIVKLAKLLGSS